MELGVVLGGIDAADTDFRRYIAVLLYLPISCPRPKIARPNCYTIVAHPLLRS